ncbi:pimeloyl-ACP methyl ester carboxylesterase [Breznakia sp. PF5-3]|uniref:alpha/beta fold hydrolase n=1 Tax=unclassified Breznakia TaxID=2623764 RepID=UPI002404F746|nr:MULTISPECIES: alpha/beta hydrolase [unclassified Breznakia]MDL2276785.1 alpha/beta hydrolase [Breznakia sp. OttesenSCG-928-G09]MDF9823991.1 pimeloyl-ACP methyl ester carboxylesterase [Breznakia sp. PM6-1]MDF9834790.1 pimeloyl-ACP methyl ester carboxylesterase [Breznakia sp. PF5-3]MDF9838057.1 pimeloyl-ACP methyl ester carboxylesterase [Breznakia sp. PFB2-8]MDF9860043.1 pimeloyl-ACP methyl ester carboxylesterase [Breznakia sp. PH5-24]
MAYFNYDNKKIYYEEHGDGIPVIFLHGNTASGKMFEHLIPLYDSSFKLILIDFLGHGKSDRLDAFPVELWKDEAKQTIALIEHLNYKKINLVGTSGGAYVCLYVAFERPDLVNKVVADSFDGRTLGEGFEKGLSIERSKSIIDPNISQLYKWWQGEDWKDIVQKDTTSLIALAKQKKELFPKPFKELTTPVLLTGTEKDNLTMNSIHDEYNTIASEMNNCSIHIFETGAHPSILTNAEKMAELINHFICD